jgi:hypothetical protein
MDVQTPEKKKTEDVYTKTSDRKGLYGIVESFLRRFRIFAFLFTLLPLYLLCIAAMGISATPGVYLFYFMRDISSGWPKALHYAATGTGIFGGYFLYGLTLIFVVQLINFLIPVRLRPFRGGFFSLSTVPWYIHTALTYVVRYTFLEYLTPTPLNILFYRLMGMKIGRDSHINTTNISDPCLIEIGDKVTVGGSATIIAHYASQGYLIIERTKIASGVTIGLKATIMGDTEIGEGATIGPHEVVLPKSRIPAGRKFEK